MNFKTYDILSSLVPGFLLLLVMIKSFNLKYESELIICYTALAFLLGYVVNTLGSWLEDFYFWSWRGKPSSKLLEGKNIWKIRLYNSAQLRAHLSQKAANQNPTSDELFSIAMRYANGQKDSRIEDFNTMYAFSRTLLTTVLVSSSFVIYKYSSDWQVYLIASIVIIIFWIRCKQRGYYFSKEVLNVYSRMNNL